MSVFGFSVAGFAHKKACPRRSTLETVRIRGELRLADLHCGIGTCAIPARKFNKVSNSITKPNL
jgi:hypothetical protein